MFQTTNQWYIMAIAVFNIPSHFITCGLLENHPEQFDDFPSYKLPFIEELPLQRFIAKEYKYIYM